MAEEKKAAEQAGEGQPKKSKKKLIIIIAACLILVGVAGFATYSVLSGSGLFGFFVKEKADKKKEKEKKPEKTFLLALDPFILNLAEKGRFVKLSLHIEYTDATIQESVKEKTPLLRDAIITLMGAKSKESIDSAEGKMQLKDEILMRANQAYGKDVFKNVYFTEFIIQ